MNPASTRCQRWHRRQHSWIHPDQGGFDRRQYDVAAIADDNTARAFIERHHYSGSYPAALQRYGLYERGGNLVGVAVLSGPVQESVLTNVFPGLEPYAESAELGRFVLLDQVPANAETFFLAEAYRLAARKGMRGVVSFSDPVPRYDAQGHCTLAGHVGTIYQASNATYLGRGTPRSLVMLPDGTVLNDRARQKIRKREQGWEYVERDLVAWGARPLEHGESGAAWMREVLPSIGATRQRHRGNHKYAFAVGDRRARRGLRIVGNPEPYPKQADAPITRLEDVRATRHLADAA